jgi:hypothetical protein
VSLGVTITSVRKVGPQGGPWPLSTPIRVVGLTFTVEGGTAFAFADESYAVNCFIHDFSTSTDYNPLNDPPAVSAGHTGWQSSFALDGAISAGGLVAQLVGSVSQIVATYGPIPIQVVQS